jgi:hypothetical protein
MIQRIVGGNRRDSLQGKHTKATRFVTARSQRLHSLLRARRTISQQVLDSADRMMKKYQADLKYLKDR